MRQDEEHMIYKVPSLLQTYILIISILLLSNGCINPGGGGGVY